MVGFGTVASTVLIGLGNILSLLLGFILRKKAEVLVILVAVLAPVLYLKGFYDPAKADPASLGTAIDNNDIGGVIDSLGVVVPSHNSSHPSHNSSHHSEAESKEGRSVGSVVSSLFTALFWPLQSIFLWPVQLISRLLGIGTESLPLISSDTSAGQEETVITDQLDQERIESVEQLQEVVQEAVRQHVGQYEEEIQRIRFTLYDHAVKIDTAVVASIEEKYGQGAWRHALSSLLESSALSKRSAPDSDKETFRLELTSVVGDMVTQVMNIKSDVWSSVQKVRKVRL